MTVPVFSIVTFTMERLLFIATFKTALYSFYMSIAASLLLCGFAIEKNLRTTKELCVPMGE